MVTLIVRAKKNYVAYFEAQNTHHNGPGCPPKYGDKVVLMESFDQKHLFSKMDCMIYGKLEEVLILTCDLLWKPTGRMIRFVLAETSRGRIVLMCSDLTMEPLVALELYCARTRIEIMFDMLKNMIGAFNYHFWSKGLPRHSRKPKKNDKLQKPSAQELNNVKNCWKAIEGFVMMGSISLGLLQFIGHKYQTSIWKHFDIFLRTRSRQLPSERTVKHVVGRFILKSFLHLATSGIMREIQNLLFTKKIKPIFLKNRK